jgi:hypothetical protein
MCNHERQLLVSSPIPTVDVLLAGTLVEVRALQWLMYRCNKLTLLIMPPKEDGSCR